MMKFTLKINEFLYNILFWLFSLLFYSGAALMGFIVYVATVKGAILERFRTRFRLSNNNKINGKTKGVQINLTCERNTP